MRVCERARESACASAVTSHAHQPVLIASIASIGVALDEDEPLFENVTPTETPVFVSFCSQINIIIIVSILHEQISIGKMYQNPGMHPIQKPDREKKMLVATLPER